MLSLVSIGPTHANTRQIQSPRDERETWRPNHRTSDTHRNRLTCSTMQLSRVHTSHSLHFTSSEVSRGEGSAPEFSLRRWRRLAASAWNLDQCQVLAGHFHQFEEVSRLALVVECVIYDESPIMIQTHASFVKKTFSNPTVMPLHLAVPSRHKLRHSEKICTKLLQTHPSFGYLVQSQTRDDSY